MKTEGMIVWLARMSEKRVLSSGVKPTNGVEATRTSEVKSRTNERARPHLVQRWYLSAPKVKRDEQNRTTERKASKMR